MIHEGTSTKTMKRLFTILAAIAVLGWTVPSWGDNFEFSGNSNGVGTFNYSTSTGTLTVTGAQIDTLLTSFDNGIGPCQPNGCTVDGTLNLTLLDGTGNPEPGPISFDSTGSSLSITGTVMDGSTVIASGNLLTASFLGGATLQCFGGTNGGTCDFSGALDASTIGLNPDLNTNGQGPEGGTASGQQLILQLTGTGDYSGTVTSADAQVTTAPEPGSVALLGSAFVGFFGFLRGKKLPG